MKDHNLVSLLKQGICNDTELESLSSSGFQLPVVHTDCLSINKSPMKSDSCIYTVIKTHEPRRLNKPKQNKWEQRIPTHLKCMWTKVDQVWTVSEPVFLHINVHFFK